MRKMTVSEYSYESYCRHCADRLWCSGSSSPREVICRVMSCAAVRPLKSQGRDTSMSGSGININPNRDGKKRKNPPSLELHGLKTKKAAIKYSLNKIPRKLRGEAAEHLILLWLLEHGIRCERAAESYIDWFAFPAFKKDAKKTPLQIKSISLKMHGYMIRVDNAPLELFEGWYVILIEHKLRDFLLFIPSDKMKLIMKEKGRKYKEREKMHHKGEWTLLIPSNLGNDWSSYLDPGRFIEDVFSREGSQTEGSD